MVFNLHIHKHSGQDLLQLVERDVCRFENDLHNVDYLLHSKPLLLQIFASLQQTVNGFVALIVERNIYGVPDVVSEVSIHPVGIAESHYSNKFVFDCLNIRVSV